MLSSLFQPLRAGALLGAAWLAFPCAAQTNALDALPPEAAASPATVQADDADVQPSRANQRIEHIQHSDSGATIDELRVGGETRSIHVQPRHNMPSYDVVPHKGAPSATEGRRVWKVMRF